MSSATFTRAAVLLRRRFLAAFAVVMGLSIVAPSACAAAVGAVAPPIRVVASFSILGDMVREVGGDRVMVATLVGRGADPHSFEPSPNDVQALSQAQLLVVNGLGFEGWLPRLVDAAGFSGGQLVVSEGATVRHLGPGEVLEAGEEAHRPAHGEEGHDHEHDHGHDHGEPGSIDPHAWQDLANGMIYARNIATGLSKVQPASASYFSQRADIYIEKMKKLDAEIKQALQAIPENKRTVITSHDAFGYFGRAYGIRFISIAGLSNEAEPSAKAMAAIIDRARQEKASGLFVERGTSRKLVDQIARETGVLVGGTLYSDALGQLDEPSATYLGMFSWNAGRLIYVLTR